LSSRKQFLRVSPYFANTFGAISWPNLPFERFRGNEISRRRLAEKSHIRSFYLADKAICWMSNKRYSVSICCKSSWPSGTRFARGQKRDVSRGRLAFLFIFCLLHSQKCDMGNVRKSTIPVFHTPCNFIFWLLDTHFVPFGDRKRHFRDVEKKRFFKETPGRKKSFYPSVKLKFPYWHGSLMRFLLLFDIIFYLF
jgi:hypothetical protein